ncbi:Protein SRG1 [Linum perenne]
MVNDPSFTAGGGTVPERYIRRDQDPPSAASSAVEVPVIDMQKLMDPCSSDAELHRLHQTCQNWGFFQLVNHRVPDSLMKKVSTEVKQWLNLPMEEKKKFWQRRDDIEGFGQAFVVSKEQKLDWGDMFYVTTLPKHLRKPFPFHSLPAQFRETLESYSSSLETLAMKILTLMAKALGMDPNEMAEMFKDGEGWQNLRINYYPPCPKPELVMGLNSHSDAVGLTILLQISDEPGLQIKKDGRWALVTPLPDAFIVNVGDILEIISNGAYKSIEHRATVNSNTERLSVATFLSPKLDGELGPAQSLVTPNTPPKFKRLLVKDYFKGLFERELNGKSYLDAMKV